MHIKTPQLGDINYDESEIIHFPEGLYGFEQLKKFLFVSGNSQPMFSYLQSIENTDVTFIIADPKKMVENYILMISRADLEKIRAKSELDLQDYVIITIPENIEDISANLLGPVVINEKLNLGAQLISQNSEYSTKYKILEKVQSKVS